jgi:hypothetical protein
MMPRNRLLEVKNGDVTGALRGFLKSLLEKRLLDALLVPVAVPSGKNVVQTLVEEIGQIDRCEPLAPVMPVNSAKIVSSLTRTGAPGKKVGVVLRSCELRALQELVKLKQADLTNLVLIGVDCFGTYSVSDYREAGVSTDAFLKNAPVESDPKLRPSCKVCRYPMPLNADLVIGLFGMDLNRGLLIRGETAEGERLLGALAIDGDADAAKRDAAVAKLAAVREGEVTEFLQKVPPNSGAFKTCFPHCPPASPATTAGWPARSATVGNVCWIHPPLPSGKATSTWSGPARKARCACPPTLSFSTWSGSTTWGHPVSPAAFVRTHARTPSKYSNCSVWEGRRCSSCSITFPAEAWGTNFR